MADKKDNVEGVPGEWLKDLEMEFTENIDMRIQIDFLNNIFILP